MDPFNRLRTTARHCLMIASAKGGVGKSTITVNLAAALTVRGQKVGIFDADIHGPDIPALLGIKQTRNLYAGLNLESMIPIEARPDSLDLQPIKPITRYGIQVMSLGLLVGERQTLNPDPQIIGQMITFLLARVDWSGVDIVILDMPPGTGDPFTHILQSKLVDGVLLVTLREELAHLDNGRLITLLQTFQMPVLGVVENMTHIICPKCGELIELFPASASQEIVYGQIPVVASIPFHQHLIRQVRSGPPIPLAEPEGTQAQPFFSLADQVINYIKKSD